MDLRDGRVTRGDLMGPVREGLEAQVGRMDQAELMSFIEGIYLAQEGPRTVALATAVLRCLPGPPTPETAALFLGMQAGVLGFTPADFRTAIRDQPEFT